MAHCAHVRLPGPERENEAYYTGKGAHNCTIYDSSAKPDCCTGYKCSWLLGYGGDEDRPDKALMLFDDTKGIGNSLLGKPLKDGQELTREGRAVAQRMSESAGVPVIVMSFYERRPQYVVGGPWQS